MQTKTIQQVRTEFDESGMSYAQWCRDNNVSQQVVKDLLTGRIKGRRGLAHNAAVKLGLKKGTLLKFPKQEQTA